MLSNLRRAAEDLDGALARVATLQAELTRTAAGRDMLQARASGLGWYIAGLRITAALVDQTTQAIPVRRVPKRGHLGRGAGFGVAGDAAALEWKGQAGEAFTSQMQRLNTKVADSSDDIVDWARQQAGECRRAAEEAQAMLNQVESQLDIANRRLARIPGQIAAAERDVAAARVNLDVANAAAAGGS